MPQRCAVIGTPSTASAFLRVLAELDVPHERFDRIGDVPSEEYGSIAVLADDYPAVHHIDDADAKLLAAHVDQGRSVYVEYATDGTGLLPTPQDEPRTANFERIYVADGNEITNGFEALTTFDEHSSSLLPVVRPVGAAEPLSYGTVAGTHRAVFGPPDETWPALLDISRGPGRLLYASTALSNAVRGRYKPAKRWHRLLRNLLGTLAGYDEVPAPPDLVTSPRVWAATGTPVTLRSTAQTVTTSDGSLNLHEADGVFESDPLDLTDGRHTFTIDGAETTIEVGPRDERYRRMVDRGIAWFDNAGMFFGADGEKGVAEGFSNELGPDGVPPFREQPRADGYVQVAHAFRMYAGLADDPRGSLVADNLMRLVLDEMQLLDRNPLYGSFEPRGARHDFTGTNNLFADDNGWIALFAMVSGAVDQGLRGTEALVRTAHHELGLQTNPWRTPTTLMVNGWEGMQRLPFHDALDLSSHWNSSAQSAFLYAYAITGEQRYLDVATAGLDHMAEEFPRTRLETSRTCEAVRFLFPLAAGYFYTRKPLYLQTMRAIADYLREHQDPVSGAIAEWDGRGPISNAAYGTDEASIFQANGDTVTDQLYGTAYAALALPVAFQATGEQVFADLATGVLDYLSRIQLDEGEPLLDGTWLRAFDYEIWDYFGSNCDAGWGPYCVETGWCQGPALIGAMLHLTGEPFFPSPSDEHADVARQVLKEFDSIASGMPAEVTFERRDDGRVIRHQTVEGAGTVASLVGELRAAGKPAWIRYRDAVEVYVRGEDGLLYHSYLHDRLGQGDWTAVSDLEIADDPAVAYNAGADAVEVYARGTDGVLRHTSMADVRAGHTPWIPVGNVPFTGVPAVEYRPDLGTVEVTARDAGGEERSTVKENRWHRPWQVENQWISG